MIKEIFGWLIAVCRRWAIGSSHRNKTSRAIYGLSIICWLYMLGLAFHGLALVEPEFDLPSWMDSDSALATAVILLFVIPLTILKKVFKDNIVDAYIEKYKPKDLSHNTKQQLFAFLFCLVGWLMLFGPFLIYANA